MKNRALPVVVAIAALPAFCLAEVVTINPSGGEETNVVARITGETSVAVNTGATGGGIVRLNSANSYSGGTTLNSGTLVLKSAEDAKGVSDIGTGDVTRGVATRCMSISRVDLTRAVSIFVLSTASRSGRRCSIREPNSRRRSS